MECYRVSERRACKLLQLARSTFRYTSTKDEQAPLRMRLKELAATRVRYGYRLHILLRREGWNINEKRVYRLYCEENLSLRTKTPKRRVSCRNRADRSEAIRINDCWAMDFMADELFDGRKIRLLTIVDHFTRESIASTSANAFAARMSSQLWNELVSIVLFQKRFVSTMAQSLLRKLWTAGNLRHFSHCLRPYSSSGFSTVKAIAVQIHRLRTTGFSEHIFA